MSLTTLASLQHAKGPLPVASQAIRKEISQGVAQALDRGSICLVESAERLWLERSAAENLECTLEQCMLAKEHA